MILGLNPKEQTSPQRKKMGIAFLKGRIKEQISKSSLRFSYVERNYDSISQRFCTGKIDTISLHGTKVNFFSSI